MKIKYLESLRGLASFFIVIVHTNIFTTILKIDFIINGYLFVDFFFILSGFVIAYNYLNKLKDRNQFLLFIKRRFLRLYPLHFFLLIIYFLLNYLQVKLGFQFEEDFNNIKSFFANLSLTQALIPDFGRSYNSVSWSISVEFYTYILFAFLVTLLRNNIKIFIFIIIISIFLSNLYLINNGFQFNFSHNQIIRCINGFFQGVLIFIFMKKFNFKNIKFLTYIILLILFIILSMNKPSNYLQCIFVLFVSFLILALLQEKNNYLIKFLENPIFVYLGKISYSTYMTHFIIAMGFKYVLIILNINVSELIYFQLILIFMYLVLVIFLSRVTHSFIEMKFYN